MARYYGRRRRYRQYRRNDPIAELIALGLLGLGFWLYQSPKKVIFLVIGTIAAFIIYQFYKKQNPISSVQTSTHSLELPAISVSQESADKPVVLQNTPEEKLPYRKRDYLLTIAEKNFYQVLVQIADRNNFLIQSKVRLEDLLLPLPWWTKNRGAIRNRVKSRHIDFVLCDKQTIRPLLAVELDDSSHQRADRIERDERVDNILQDAGLPILHIRVHTFYDFISLESQILNKLNPLAKTQQRGLLP